MILILGQFLLPKSMKSLATGFQKSLKGLDFWEEEASALFGSEFIAQVKGR